MAKQIEPFYEALGAKIQEWRGARKMTQAQLGLVLNPSSTRASIANIENGKQRVLVHTLVQLAKALEVEIYTLLPPVQEVARTATPKDVELELRRKLNLATPQLRKLVGAARPAAAGSREKT